MIQNRVMALNREQVGFCEVGSRVDGEVPGNSGKDGECAKEKEGEEAEEHECYRPSGHGSLARGRRDRRGVVKVIVCELYLSKCPNGN